MPSTPWFGSACNNYSKLIFMCGASTSSYRYIVVNKNVLRDGLTGFPETGLILESKNADGSTFAVAANEIWADTSNNPQLGRAWFGGGNGCGETNPNLTTKNGCSTEVANCFGQGLGDTQPRYLWIYGA